MSGGGSSAGPANTLRRLTRELTAYRSDPNPCLTYLYPPDESNLLKWRAGLRGTPQSPYEGAVWTVDIAVPENYPLSPPVITFVTKICHPNVHFKSGEVCLDLLKTAWSAAYTLSTTMTAVQTLLTTPEPDSPLNVDAAGLIRSGDNVGYESLVKYYVWRYAIPEGDPRAYGPNGTNITGGSGGGGGGNSGQGPMSGITAGLAAGGAGRR